MAFVATRFEIVATHVILRELPEIRLDDVKFVTDKLGMFDNPKSNVPVTVKS